MFSPDDTIVAIATPPGRGGIGVVRISGPDAHRVASAILRHAQPLEPRRATFSRLSRGSRAEVAVGDEVVVAFFPAPHSYTGQDVVEISAHGSPVVLQSIVERAITQGARLAEPGEFTLRAFLNGKRDLVQSEAVADLIEAVTPLQARTAFDQLEGSLTDRISSIDATLFDLITRLEASLDFPDEGYHFIEPATIANDVATIVSQINDLLSEARRGRLIRDGAQVVIAGRPNVGKSSLFNALAGADRAIVTEVPGTTRDLVTERVDIEGLAVTLVDTAGVRDTLDIVEREGVARGDRAREVADLVLVVLDARDLLEPQDERLLERTRGRPRIVVINKIDLVRDIERHLPALQQRLTAGGTTHEGSPITCVSATTAIGVDELRGGIVRALTGRESMRDSPAISNTRHIALLERARAALEAAHTAAVATSPEEFVLADLQSARQAFDEIVGRRTSDDVLARIFERFCIGK
jgi:tRNA modification GTPase